MYDLGRQVVITAPGYEHTIGKITERNFVIIRGKRRASYVVTYHMRPHPSVSSTRTYDVTLGSKDIRAADFCCDACGKWRKQSQLGERGVAGEDTYLFCWLCIQVGKRDLERFHREIYAREIFTKHNLSVKEVE